MFLSKIYGFFKRHKDVRNESVSRNVPVEHRTRRASDSDRRYVGMLEERMAFEQNCDWTSGSRNAQKSFSKQLVNVAKELGIYLTKAQCADLGEFVPIRSGESRIYENAAQGLIYKIRDPFAKLHLKSLDLRCILYEHVVHNILFPETRYAFVGVTGEEDDARMIYSQSIFFKNNYPTQQQIDKRLNEIGLLPEPYYYYGNEYVSVTDVNENSDNVLISDDTLLFIDPVIKIKKNPNEVIDFLLQE